jgi:hypothetical protein
LQYRIILAGCLSVGVFVGFFLVFVIVSYRNAEKQLVAESDEIEPGTEWERIAKLCDFNPKSSKTSKDVSRMRSIILQLKQTPPAARRA